MAFSRLNLTYHDYNYDKGQVSFRGAEMTSGNFSVIESQHSALQAAVEDVSIGLLIKTIAIATEEKPAEGAATAQEAESSSKWLVRATDDETGAWVHMSIPCPDFSLRAPNSNNLDPTDPKYTALKNAVEAYQLSQGGNAVTVQEVVLVSRNA